jgi:hypothetical protein
MTKAGFAGDDAPRAVFRKSDEIYSSVEVLIFPQHQLLEDLDTMGEWISQQNDTYAVDNTGHQDHDWHGSERLICRRRGSIETRHSHPEISH